MELLIVVALLAMVLTLSLPSLRKLSAKSELRTAARQLRVTLLETRLAAIDSGGLAYFRYQPGGGRFEVGRRTRVSSPPHQTRQEPDVTEPDQFDVGTTAGDEVTEPQSLPRGVRFADPSTDRQLAPPAAVSDVPDDDSWSAPIVFYANGRTRNARIALSNDLYRIELNVRRIDWHGTDFTGRTSAAGVGIAGKAAGGRHAESGAGGRAMTIARSREFSGREARLRGRSRASARSARRAGFSLLEVMLATSILLACLIVLGELASVGRRHARDAEQLTAAQLLARTRLNEILAGAAPLESQSASDDAELPGWSCKVQVEPLGRLGLSSVTVTVARVPAETLETPTGRGGKSFSLTRWVHSSDRGLAAAEGP